MDQAQLSQSVNQLSSTTQQLTQIMQNVASANSAHVRQQVEATNVTNELTKALKDNRKLTAAQEQLIERVNAAKLREVEAIKKAAEIRQQLLELDRAAVKDQAQINALKRLEAEAQMDVSDAMHELKESSYELQSSLKQSRTMNQFAAAATAKFAAMMKTAGREVKEQYQATGGLIEGTDLLTSVFKTQYNALLQGMDPADFQRQVVANREIINAMGGTASAINQLNPAIDRMRAVTGNNSEAMRLTMEAANQLSMVGIKPTAAALTAYQNDIMQMRKVSGLGQQAAQDFFKSIESDTEASFLLKTSKVAERSAILQSQRAFAVHTQTLIGSTEQTKQMIKTINGMLAARPVERIKQAQQIRAIGGALGVQGYDEAARIIMSGQAKTEKEYETIRSVVAQLTKLQNDARGNLQAEIPITAMLDAINLGELTRSQAFNMEATRETRGTPQEVADKLTDITTTSTGQMVSLLTNIGGAITSLAEGKSLAGAAIVGTFALMTAHIAPTLASIAARMKPDGVFDVPGGGKGDKWYNKAGRALKGVGKVAGVAGAVAGIADTSSKLWNNEELFSSPLDFLNPAEYGAWIGGKTQDVARWTADKVGLTKLMGMGENESLGSWIAGILHPVDVTTSTPLQMPAQTKPNLVTKVAPPTAEKATDTLESLAATAAQQAQQTGASASTLTMIHQTLTKMVDLSEKQLRASLATEQEKTQMAQRPGDRSQYIPQFSPVGGI